MAKRIAEARTKRTAAKLTGGRSLKPSLMKSHVEPQMQQRRRKTARAFIQSLYDRRGRKRKRQKRKQARCSLLPFAFLRSALFRLGGGQRRSRGASARVSRSA